jgi:RimJ/RimL family protein N-acetyltransferase
LELAGTTQRLEMYRLSAVHARPLVEAFADPAVRAFIPDEPATVEAMIERITRVATGPPADRPDEVWVNFAFLLQGRAIGRIEATVQNGIAEIAYIIGPAYGGRGLATEAVEWLIDRVWQRWPTIPIYACIAERNERSRRLVGRLGFIETSPDGIPLMSSDAGDAVYVFNAGRRAPTDEIDNRPG